MKRSLRLSTLLVLDVGMATFWRRWRRAVAHVGRRCSLCVVPAVAYCHIRASMGCSGSAQVAGGSFTTLRFLPRRHARMITDARPLEAQSTAVSPTVAVNPIPLTQ